MTPRAQVDPASPCEESKDIPSREALLASIEKRKAFLSAKLSELELEMREIRLELSSWQHSPSARRGFKPAKAGAERVEPEDGYRGRLAALIREVLTEQGEMPFPKIVSFLREHRKAHGLSRIREQSIREILSTSVYRETERGFSIAANAAS